MGRLLLTLLAVIFLAARLLRHRFPHHLTIRRLDMVPLDPGQSPQFMAIPNPGSSLGSVVPAWSCSDATFGIVVDESGLVATVGIPDSATVGETVTLTVTATDPKTGATATGTLDFTIGAAAQPFPTSFTISQVA